MQWDNAVTFPFIKTKTKTYGLTNWYILEWSMAIDNSLLICVLVPLESDQHPGVFIINFWEQKKNEVILTGFEWLRRCFHAPTLILVVIAVLTYVKMYSVPKLL